MAPPPKTEVHANTASDKDAGKTSDVKNQPSALHEQYLSEQEKARAKDKTTPVAARTETEEKNPQKLMQQVQVAVDVLQMHGKNDSEKSTVTGPDGKTYETTVGQRRKSELEFLKREHKIELSDNPEALKKFIDNTSAKAIGAVDAIKQTGDGNSVASLLKDNTQKLDAVAKQANVNTDNLTANQIADKVKDLPAAKDVLVEREMLQSLERAPAAIRLAVAELKMRGLTDSAATPGQASAKEIMDAYALVREAGRSNADARNSEYFQQLNGTVSGQYAVLQEGRCGQVIQELQKALELNKGGKTAEAEVEFKKALQLAEGVDMKFIAAQLRDPDNAKNPEVAQRLVQIIQTGKEARMEYAQFLNSQGRYDEALPLVLKVQADTPELAQQDKTVAKVFNEATFGKSMPSGDLQAHQLEFNKAIQAKDYDKAKQELDMMRKGFQDEKAQIEKGSASLQSERKNVDEQLKALDKNTTLDETERAIEKQRLQNELKLMDENLKMNGEVAKQSSWINYLSGVLAYSKGDNNEAHTYFEAVKNTSPDLANNPQLKLNDLLEVTREHSWYEWNSLKRGVVVGGAILAGVGVAAATIWSGPGSVAAGMTAGTAVLAVGGASLAGAGVYTAGTWAIGDKVTWRTPLDGALLGATGAGLVVTGPLLAGLAPEVGSTVAGANILRMAATSRLAAPAVVGFTSSAGHEALNVGFDGKSFGDAAWDATKNGAFNTLGYMLIPGLGKALPVSATAAGTRSACFTQVMRTSGVGAMKWQPDMLSQFTIPTIANAYNAYSPIDARLPLLGRPARFGLDPQDMGDQKKLWSRWDGINPSLTAPGQ